MAKTINPMLTRCSALALSTSLLFMGSVASAQSFNGTGTVVEGDATITEGPGTTDITVETQSAVIDWTPDDDAIANFVDIAFQDAGTTATFTNGTGITNFAVLNRILPSDVTRSIVFDGNIVSQIQDGMGGVATGGTVFFYTPGGIIIGANATIDVGALGLTTAAPLTDGNGNFIDVGNKVEFQQSQSGVAIQIEQGAQINALNEGSYVAMFAPRIGQFGDIAVNGSVGLVAAEAGTMTFSPDGLFDIEVTIGTDAGFGAIDHRGSTGGPGSSGPGDNHHAYLVAVPKNTALSLAINGGSALGFDIAQSAFVDGNEVVLSAGHNITAGTIDAAPAMAGNGNDASIDLTDDDQGFGSGLLFTSRVDARAISSVSGFLTHDVIFQDTATFAAGEILLTFGNNGTRAASLLVDGDLELFADSPAFGNDVGVSFLDVIDTAQAQINGDLTISSRAQFDEDSSGTVQSNFARAFASNGGDLAVLGNLIVDAGVDLRADRGGPVAQSGTAQVFLDGGGFISVDGVTRIVSDAYAAEGVSAFSSVAELNVNNASDFFTGELNISADAYGGVDGGSGAGSAQAGRAEIAVFGGGATVTVANVNTIGVAANGELDFLSAEAFGADGVVGNGGDATSGQVGIQANAGATVNLPNSTSAPLFVRNRAVGGNTSASDAFGGTASLGQTLFGLFDSSGDLGRLSILVEGLGGSAGGGAQRSTGGSVSGGAVSIDFANGTYDVAFDQILVDMVGGNASSDNADVGGAALGDFVNFTVSDANLNILSDLALITQAVGGDGLAGGAARPSAVNINLNNSDIQINGDLILSSSAEGGAAFGQSLFDPQFGTIAVVGADANVDPSSINFFNSNVTLTGGVDASIIAVGGSAVGGFAGAANTQGLEFTISGNVAFNAAFVRLINEAIGGSILQGGFGAGGDANVGNARFAIQEFVNPQPGPNDPTEGTYNIAGNIAVTNAAFGGEGPDVVFAADPNFADFGRGGNAFAGFATFDGTNAGTLSVGGNLSVSSTVIGGNAPIGSGGGSNTNGSEVFFNGLNGQITGDLLLDTQSESGSGEEGGFASNNGIRVFVGNGSFFDVLGSTTLNAGSIGGDALGAQARSGGEASIGFVNFEVDNATADIATDLEIFAEASGGSGELGGSTSIFNVRVALTNSSAAIGGDLTVDTLVTGGTAFGTDLVDPFTGAEPAVVGGNADISSTEVNAFNSSLDVGGALAVTAQALGGDAQDTKGGFARSGLADVRLTGTSSLSAASITAVSEATGGSILTGGIGRGGLAETNNARLITEQDFNTGIANNTVSATGDVTLATLATGGSGGDVEPDPQGLFFRDTTGGQANSRFASVDGFGSGTLNIGGNLSATSTATGGSSFFSTGGAAFADPSSIVSLGLATTIQGNADFRSLAFGGDGVNGGEGNAQGTRIVIQDTTADFLGLTSMVTRAIGGNALNSPQGGFGGNAFGAFSDFNISNSVVDIDLVQALSEMRGGSGANIVSSEGGFAGPSLFNVFVDNSDVAFRGDMAIIRRSEGGNGFSGGGADAGSHETNIQNGSTVTVAGSFTAEGVAQGGTALGAGFDDAANGGANAFDGGTGGSATTQTAFLNVDGSVLDATGTISSTNTSVGGNAIDGDGGAAFSGEVFSQIRDQTIITTQSFDIASSAIGGSGGAGGTGNGGEATALRVAFDINGFDPQTGGQRTNTDVVVNANVTTASEATGGQAGGLGGDGGNATSQQSSLEGVVPGTFILNGSYTGESNATGGNAPVGIGGLASNGGATVFNAGFPDPNTGEVTRGIDITINGNLTLSENATGGDGQTGGGATNSLVQIFSRNASLDVSGTAFLVATASGGNALDSDTPGIGGGATGGDFRVLPESRPGDTPTQITLGNLTIINASSGGDGGNGLNGADGGMGGDGIGANLLVLARAFDGTLNVTGSADITTNGIGGKGGDGVNGGQGGFGASGTIQLGSSSGESIPGAVNGSANYDDITITHLGVGGDGGNATTGVGGRGGDGQGRFLGLLVRGAPINATSIVASSTGTGGNGGAGATAGDGGDGIAGFASLLISEAFENPGRGSSDIGSLTVRSEGIGGAGSTPGNSFYATGGRFQLVNSDVSIGSVDIQLLGTDFPDFTVDDGMGNQIPATVTPFDFNLANSTLDVGTVNIVTPGDLQLVLDDSTLTATLFSIIAGAVVLPDPDPNADPNAPAPIPGTIDVDQQLSLTATQGDLAAEVNLISGTAIDLDAQGSILIGDLTAPSISLQVVTGTITTGVVTSQGGAITIETLDDLDLGAAFESASAPSINARSINGNVFASAPISITGDLSVEAALAITLGDVSANTFTATAANGGITTGNLTAPGGAVTLTATDSITVGEITALDAIVRSSGGDFTSTGLINLLASLVDIDVAGSISLAGINATTVDLASQTGDITSSDAIVIDGDLSAIAGGSIILDDVIASSISSNAQGGTLTTGALVADQGLINLTASSGITFDTVSADAMSVSTASGPVNALGLIDLDNLLTVSGSAITLSDVSAGGIIATSASLAAGSLDAGIGDISITSSLGVDLAEVSAGSLSIVVPMGDLNASGTLAVIDTLNLQIGGAAQLASLSGASILVNTMDGNAAIGVINGGDVALSVGTGLTLSEVTASAFDAVVRDGDLTGLAPINVTGAFSAEASNSVTLGSVTAGTIAADALGGDLTAGVLTADGGLINLSAFGSISVAGILGGALSATTEEDDIEIMDAIAVDGSVGLLSGGAITLSEVTAGSLSANALGGNLSAGALIADAGLVNLNALELISLSSVTASSLIANSTQNNIEISGLVALSDTLNAVAGGAITLSDATAGSITADALGGAFTAGSLTADAMTLNALAFIELANVSGGSLVARANGGSITTTGEVTLSSGFDVEAQGPVELTNVSASSIRANALDGDVTATGTLTAVDGVIELSAANSIELADVVAGSLQGRAQGGDFASSGLMDLSGVLDIEASQSIALVDVDAGSIDVSTANGGILGDGTITAQGTATFNAATFLQLGDLSAGQINTRSGGSTTVGGQWRAASIEVASPFLPFLTDGILDAGQEGQIALVSTNANGVLIGDPGENGEFGEFGGYTVDETALALLQAGELRIVSAANPLGSNLTVGTIDLAAAENVSAVRFDASGPAGLLRVIGEVTGDGEFGPDGLALRAGRVELDTDTGRIALPGSSSLSIAADTIIVADSALIAETAGEQGAAELIEAFNEPAFATSTDAATGTDMTPEVPEGALSAGTITLEGGSAILIQNAGTEETPVGFIVGSAEGLQINGREGSTPLVVINGQIGADETAITGDDAATAILEVQTNLANVDPRSLINGCELSGCVEVAGEITSDVSAQVNGVVDAGSNSGSGSGDAGGGNTGGNGTGDTGGSDGGDGTDGDDGSDENSGDAGATGSGATGSGDGSGSGGDIDPDNVDDGGGGNEDFNLDEGSDDGSGSGDDTSGGEDSPDDGSDSSDDGSDGSDEASDDTEGGDEEAEGSEEEAESEESEDEAEEAEEEEAEEEEEEEAAEEEEEEGEGPATGPIAAPPALISDNSLDRSVDVTDPISGNGNPGLLDPDINLPEQPTDTGGQQ